MPIESLRTRLRAGGIHLLGSLMVAALAAAMVFLLWYPRPLAEAQGVDKILVLMVAVDVVLGPLITALVFNPAKRRLLKLDLAIIITLQLSAMLYGLHTVFVGRPALIVFNIDRFDVVAAADMQDKDLMLARALGKPALPWFGPRIVGAVLPSDIKERNALMFSVIDGGADLPRLAQWHVPYSNVRDAAIKHAHPLRELRDLNAMSYDAWQAFLDSLERPPVALAYLPMRAKERDGAVIIDVRNGRVVKIVLLNPKWE